MNKINVLTQDSVLSSVLSFLRSHFPAQLEDVVLFGSRARSDYLTDSDYDLISVFNCFVTPEMKDIIRSFVIDNLLETGIVLNIISLSNAEIEKMRFEPFIMNAFKEGISH